MPINPISMKVVTRRIGHALHFCPVCRDVTSVGVNERRESIAAYGISLLDRKVVGYEIECPGCESIFQVGPRSISVVDAPIDNPHEAVKQLSPEDAEPLLERIALEERVAAGDASTDERMRLMAEPLIALESEYFSGRGRHSVTGLGALIGLGLSAASLLSVGLFIRGWAQYAVIGPAHGSLMEALACTLQAAVIIGAWKGYSIWEGRRVVAKFFVDRVVKAVQPLKPTSSEVQSVFAALRKQDIRLVKRLNEREVIRRVGASEPVRALAA